MKVYKYNITSLQKINKKRSIHLLKKKQTNPETMLNQSQMIQPINSNPPIITSPINNQQREHQQQQTQENNEQQQISIRKLAFQQFEKRMITNNITRSYFPNNQKGNPSILTRNIPFFINSQQLISESRLTRIYKCDYTDNTVQQQLMESLLQIKDTIYSVKETKDSIMSQQRSFMIDGMLNELYYNNINHLIIQKNNNLFNRQTYHSYISPLKCKIITLQQYKEGQITSIMQYLQKLRFYYQYNNHVVVSNQKDSLLTSNKKRQKQSLKLAYFNLQHRKQYTPKVIKLIADYLENHTSLISSQGQMQSPSSSSMSPSSIAINEKKQSIQIQTVTLLILDYLADQNSYIRQRTLSILIKGIKRNFKLINLQFIKKLKQLMSHKLSSTKNCAIKLLQQCLNQLKSIQKLQEKLLLQQEIIIYPNLLFKLIYLISQALDQQSSNKTKYEKDSNQNKHEKAQNQNKIQKDQNQTETQKDSNKPKTQQQYLNQRISNFQHQLKNNSPSSLTSNQNISITADQLSEILTKNYVTNVNFSSTLNVQINQNLQSYQNYTSSQKIKQTAYKEEFLYIINEYHHGKTFKELILNNWKGFQNHNVVHKLATKLFWIYAKLQYCGFDDYFPSLQSIIINQNLTMPDVNINMTSFLNSIFLFQSNEFKQKDTSLSDKYLSQKVKRSSLEQCFPFIYYDGIERGFSKVNRINHFLIILLFMICRRFDHFQGLPSILKSLKIVIEKDIEAPTKKYKQMLDKYNKQLQQKALESETKQIKLNGNDRKQKILKQIINQKLHKSKTLYDQTSKYCLVNTLKAIDLIQPFDETDRGHYLNLTLYVPQLYSIFLKKYDLPTQNVKQYEKISYKNSNTYRINEFQKYLGLKEEKLLKIFQKNLASPIKEKAFNSTWRDLFCLLFTEGKQASVEESKLLNYLCQFFNYPFKKQCDPEKLSLEIYFALKFDIDFSYFQEKYQGRWFDCFETYSNQGKIQYDMQTMCLFKKIKSQVTNITNSNVEKIIEIIQESQNILLGDQKELTTTQDDKKCICQKLKDGIDLLKYLNNYEKKVYKQELKRTEEKSRSQKKISSPKTQQKKLEYFTKDYFESFSEQDIHELEEILELFMQKMNSL